MNNKVKDLRICVSMPTPSDSQECCEQAWVEEAICLTVHEFFWGIPENRSN